MANFLGFLYQIERERWDLSLLFENEDFYFFTICLRQHWMKLPKWNSCTHMKWPISLSSVLALWMYHTPLSLLSHILLSSLSCSRTSISFYNIIGYGHDLACRRSILKSREEERRMREEIGCGCSSEKKNKKNEREEEEIKQKKKRRKRRTREKKKKRKRSRRRRKHIIDGRREKNIIGVIL